MNAEKLKRYPPHLSDPMRLKVVEAYLLHEFPSLREVIDTLIKNCEKYSNCEEIYDLFYGISLVYKRKFIAKEITSESCSWRIGKVKLRYIKLSTNIENIDKFKWELLENVVNNISEDDKKKIYQKSLEYYKKREERVNDPIIVVKEGEKYRILDGNGRVLYKLAMSNFNLDEEIDAYIAECKNYNNMCIPFGILHFIEDYPNKKEMVDIVNKLLDGIGRKFSKLRYLLRRNK